MILFDWVLVIMPLWFAIGYALGFALFALTDLLRDWWSDRQASKQTVLLPDGKGGFKALPKGSTYYPVRGESK